MTRVEWDSRLETGNDSVDGQHKELFAMLDGIAEAVESGVGDASMGPVLEGLSHYVSVHFVEEQQLMNAVELPADRQAAHIAEHVDLTRETREKILGWRSGEVHAMELVVFLAEWLEGHIRRMDMELADQVRAFSETHPETA